MKRDSREEGSDEDDVESEEESEVESDDKNPGFSGRPKADGIILERNPPNTDDQITGKWVAYIFLSRVANLFIGKILRNYFVRFCCRRGISCSNRGGMPTGKV